MPARSACFPTTPVKSELLRLSAISRPSMIPLLSENFPLKFVEPRFGARPRTSHAVGRSPRERLNGYNDFTALGIQIWFALDPRKGLEKTN